jgi:uncharacterized membrane protein YeaQ/YmgE (transglycosylase-associated protein family)
MSACARDMREDTMFLVAWISLGVIAGTIFSGIIYRRQPALIADLVLGIFGALVGGFIYTVAFARGVPRLGVASLLVAFIGAMALLGSFHKLRRMGHGR